ncbi:MAG: DsbA family protein [Rubrivivax sp.]|nr:MAG: DsbA family protein [Rubrivivax sp.]
MHYLHDPLCGWCWAASPLIQAARELLPVEAHAGGLFMDGSRRSMGPEWRAFALPHDRRIAQLSGQPFGAAYQDGLLNDASAWLDSAPPIAAILAADRLAGRGLDLLARIQQAHYVEGLQVAQPAVLRELAETLGLEGEAFAQELVACSGDVTRKHVEASRALMRRLGGRGFPTLALEQQGRLQLIDVGSWLGRVEDWRAWLQAQLAAAPGD